MHEVVERIEAATAPRTRAYGRGDHLEALRQPEGSMLTQERLGEVTWTLEKFTEAQKAIERLIEGEPSQQPPTRRHVEMLKISRELDHLAVRLEALFS